MRKEQLKNAIEKGYDLVYTVHDYFDGPLKGIADNEGIPHVYQRIFDEVQDDWSNRYYLKSISTSEFSVVLEEWATWEKWIQAFNQGLVNLESHPCLPEDRERKKELRALVNIIFRIDLDSCLIATGEFSDLEICVSKDATSIVSGIRPLKVKWHKEE